MNIPLSERLRPSTLEQIVGQDHLLDDKGVITNAIKSGNPLSIILWGPPGCGKTSIARLYAKAFKMRFESMSAIFSGIADLKKMIHEIKQTPLFGQGIVLFVDEIHRFNKAQQDAFLPLIEEGTLVLVGATAENPSFYLNNALLSRVRVLPVYPLSEKSLEVLLQRYEKEQGSLYLSKEARKLLLHFSQGDGRYLCNLIENLSTSSSDSPISREELQQLLQQRAPLFDRASDNHYNLISALHKSVRGSDPDAALYWFTRMLEGGEDPLFIARRLIRMATEDIGLADPQALQLSVAARDAYQMLGSPEGELALAEAVIYLALSPKSNRVYTAFKQARAFAKTTTHLDPPKHILNSPTPLMKEMGYGKGYEYDHDMPLKCSSQNYFPENITPPSFYQPLNQGFEREMEKRKNYFEKIKSQTRSTEY